MLPMLMLQSNRSSGVHGTSSRMIMRRTKEVLLCSMKASSALMRSLFLCVFLFSSSTIAFQSGSIFNQKTFFADHRLLASTQSYKEAVSTSSSTNNHDDATTYGIDAPYSEANYDPNAAAQYYKDRPVESLSRLSQIVGKSSGFIVDTLLDAKFNREERVRESCCCLYFPI
jgi:hypothetical protein